MVLGKMFITKWKQTFHTRKWILRDLKLTMINTMYIYIMLKFKKNICKALFTAMEINWNYIDYALYKLTSVLPLGLRLRDKLCVRNAIFWLMLYCAAEVFVKFIITKCKHHLNFTMDSDAEISSEPVVFEKREKKYQNKTSMGNFWWFNEFWTLTHRMKA